MCSSQQPATRKGFAALFLLAFAAVALVLLPNAAQPALATSPLVQTRGGRLFVVHQLHGRVKLGGDGRRRPHRGSHGEAMRRAFVGYDGGHRQSFHGDVLLLGRVAGRLPKFQRVLSLHCYLGRERRRLGRSDTLTITVTSGSYYATAFDYTGLYVAAATTRTGSLLGSTGTTIATSFDLVRTGAFLVAAIASAGSSYTAGSDFTKLSEAGGSST